jgi:hypothetical protein
MRLPSSLFSSLFPHRCPAPSPRHCCSYPTHEQSLAAGCGGCCSCPSSHRRCACSLSSLSMSSLLPISTPQAAARGGGWGCCGGGPHRPLAVVVVGRWAVLVRPCLCWCPCPHPLSLPLSFSFLLSFLLSLSLSSSSSCPIVVVVVPPAPHRPCPHCSRCSPCKRSLAAGVARAVVVPRNPVPVLVLLSSVLAPLSCPCSGSGECWDVPVVPWLSPSPSLLWSLPLSCPFPVPIVPGLMLPISTLRAVARSSSGGSWIPWAFPVSR